MRITKIEFGSYLTYSPKCDSDAAKASRNAMRALKDDEVLPNSQILTSEFIANLIRDNLNSLPFSNFFKAKPILVPTPRSSLIRPGTLWVPQRLANALAQRGLGKNVEPCLNRFKAVRKSATSQGDRPKAFEHYNSMEVQKIFPEPSEILLIDDIVTRGATLLGAANKLADAFPRAHIRVFAAMRTISPPDVFRSLFDPCVGNIELRGIDTFRRP